jgi:hypothetical protein
VPPAISTRSASLSASLFSRDRPGDLEFVARQKAQHALWRTCQRGDAAGAAAAQVGVAFQQHLHQQVAGHLPFLRRDLAGRKAHHICDPLCEHSPRTRARGARFRLFRPADQRLCAFFRQHRSAPWSSGPYFPISV